MGSGSGAIVIALAHECPGHRYMALDCSIAALETAKRNAERHALDGRIDWLCANWTTAFMPGPAVFELIVSNPPYIPQGDIDTLQPEIRDHEPRVALDGSGDGLACLARIIHAAPRFMSTGAMLALEMGFDQAAAVAALAERTGHYAEFHIVKDYSGLDRVAVMTKKG